LSGGGGSDIFIFRTSELSSSNYDTIKDFESGVDKVKLIIDESIHLTPSSQAGQISVVNPSSGSSLVGSSQSSGQTILSPISITATSENGNYKIAIDSTNEIVALLESVSLFNIQNDLIVETDIT